MTEETSPAGGVQPTAAEAAVVEAGKDNSPAAAPAVEKEVIDPRIVAVIGEEKIESAFGEQPKNGAKPAEAVKEAEVPPVEGGKPPEGKAEEKPVDVQMIAPPEPKPTRLDRRLADRYIHNLHLMGESSIPTEEEIIADLKRYSKEEKIQALHFHLAREKELRGEKPTGDDLEDEDRLAIADAEREDIRQEIRTEEHVKSVKTNFVNFIDNHPELVPGTKEHNPVLEQAVTKLTFPQGIEGPMAMTISEAFEIVTSQIQAVKDAQIAEEKKEKNAALSGVLSGSGQVVPEGKEFGWDDVKKIQEEDPDLYRRMLKEGKFKHLM